MTRAATAQASLRNRRVMRYPTETDTDSGFCRWRLMRWCDSHGVGYVLGLAGNPALERRAADATAMADRQFRRTGQPQRIFDSFAYAAGTWDRPRRVIVKAEHTEQGPNPRYLVVNVPGDPRELYEDVYCQRGDMENRIKEQQLDLFAGRTNAIGSWPTSSGCCSVPRRMSWCRRCADGPGRDGPVRAQAGTIRLRLLKVAARVVVSARRVVFHLATATR